MIKTPQADGAARYCRQSIPKAHWLKHMQTICRAFEEENTALRAHAERLAEAARKKFENNLQAEFECWLDNNPNSFDSEYLDYLWKKSPEYIDITNEWEEINQALTLYRAENPKV